MNKFRNIILIVMTISIITLIASFGFGFKAKNIEEFFTESYRYEKADTYKLEEKIEILNINTKIKNVDLKTHKEDYILIDYYNIVGEESFTFLYENGVLSIKELSKNKWFNFQFPKKEYRTINILYPEDSSYELNIISNTGNINVVDSNFSSVDIENSTGNIKFENLNVIKHINIKLETGNVRLNKANSETLNIKTDTGNINLTSIVNKDTKLKADTGNINTTKLDSKNIDVRTDTGNIKIFGDYRKHDKDLRVNTGKLTVDGEKIRGKYLIENRDPHRGKITVSADTGNIYVDNYYS